MKTYHRAGPILTIFALLLLSLADGTAQCPSFGNVTISGNTPYLCEGDMITVMIAGQDIPAGSTVDFYIGNGAFDPYNGEGDFIGSVPVTASIPDFAWVVPSNFCEEYGEADWEITGIIDPSPAAGCPNIYTPYFDIPVSCPAASLSGGGFVCEGNCPEDPNEILFTITGNDLPFVADLQVTAPLFPPFDIEDLEVTNGQQLFICLDGDFPSFDPSTNTLTIPTLAIGLTATVHVISMTSASGCPVEVSPSSITLEFIEAAAADAGDDITICSYETVSLNGSTGGSATMGMWTTAGDGVFANSSSLSTTYTPGPNDLQTGTVILTLTTMDPNGACIPAESSVTITIEPSLIIETGAPITVCNTDVANITATISDPSVPGIWETTGDGVFGDPTQLSTFYEPGTDDKASGSVTLIYTPVDPNVCVESNDPLEITIVNAPIVNVPQNIEVCSDDSITIHINVSGDFSDINWSTSGDGTIIIINDTEINFTPGPMDINNQFTIVSVTVVSIFPECGQTTYNMPVDILLCDCSPFQTVAPSSPICGDSDTLDLSTLLVEGGSGIWSITGSPPGSDPAMISGDLFITDDSDAGSYMVTFTLNFPEPECPTASTETILVSNALIPEAGASIANCGPGEVFINGMVIPFGSATVLWETLGDGMFVNASSVATSYIPGPQDSISDVVILVLHLQDSVCGNKSDTTQLLFPTPPFAEFIADTIRVCNEELMGSVLDFWSLIINGDTAGVWTNSGGVPVNFTDPSNVNFNGINPGSYTFHYQTNSAMFPCQEADYTVVIDVQECDCPFLQVQPLPGAICNDHTDINLDAFVMAGEPGTWQIITTPTGSNPATLNGSNLQIMNADPGTYRLRFSFDSAPMPLCPDSAEIEIEIVQFSGIALTGDTLSCYILPITLNAMISGSASGVVWSTSGLGTFSDSLALNPLYFPSIEDLNAAHVVLYGLTRDTAGYCDAALDSIEIQLVHPPSTTWNTLQATICNHPDSGSIVNLMSHIIGGDGTGIWTEITTSGADLTDPFNVDFDGIPPGTYQFSYLTQTAVPPCVDSSYTFTVTVEDCSCPALVIDTLPNPVCVPDAFDLSSLVINAAPGFWSVSSGPPGSAWPEINGFTLSTSGAEEGSYRLTYRLNDSIPGCPASFDIPLVILSAPGINITSAQCSDTSLTWSVNFSTSASEIIPSAGILTVMSPGNYLLENISIDQDLLLELISFQGCDSSYLITSPDCACTLDAEAISDTILLCPGDTFVLIPFLTGAQGLVFSTWISDVTLMRPTLPLYEPNTWIWIARDSAGCEVRDTFEVVLRELIGIEAFGIAPSCEGLDNGALVLSSIEGGQGPYEVTINQNPPFTPLQLPDTIPDLQAGEYLLTAENQDGCKTSVTVMIENSNSDMIDLGPDVSIIEGDSVLITPDLGDIESAGFDWDPQDLNASLEPFWYQPSATVTVRLTVTDSLGCIYEDELTIHVLVEQKIYIPNAFSPNGDQINDLLEIFISGAYPVESLEIFDRWGNVLYHQGGSQSLSWDGTTKGKEAAPGVYVVKVVWKDENGDPEIFIRDITLIR